jgi:hypothetical protein
MLCQQHRTATTCELQISLDCTFSDSNARGHAQHCTSFIHNNSQMGLIKRVSKALTSAGRLFTSGLQPFVTGNATVHDEPDHDSAVHSLLADDSCKMPVDTELVAPSAPPRSGSDSDCQHGLDASGVHTGQHSNESSDDASSDAASEDSWAFGSPPLVLNYDAIKHIGTHLIPGSHGCCTDISTLQRGQFHEVRIFAFQRRLDLYRPLYS